MLGSRNRVSTRPKAGFEETALTDSQPVSAVALPSWHWAVASKHKQQNGEGNFSTVALTQHLSESKLLQMAHMGVSNNKGILMCALNSRTLILM